MKNFIAALLVIVCILPRTGHTVTYYVSQSGGNDLYNGLEPEALEALNGPFKTITKAASVIQSSDSILIRAGNYPEQVIITSSGTDDSPIVITNYPGEIPVLTAADWNGSYALNLNNVSYIHIIGLEFRDSAEDRKAVLLDNSHYCVISGCSFINNAGSATVHLKNGCFFNEISDCSFQDNGNADRIWDSHIYLQNCGNLNRIKHNTFSQSQPGENLTDRGVWCAGTSNTLFTQNTFQYLEKVALYIGIENAQYEGGETSPAYNIVTDNDFVSNSGAGCLLLNTNSATVSNCRFYENRGEYTLAINGMGSVDNLVDGNIFRENWSLLAEHSCHISISQAGAGNIIRNNTIYGTPDKSIFQIVKSYTAIHIVDTERITINDNEIYDLCYPATIDKREYNSSWIKTPQQGGKAGHGIYVEGDEIFVNTITLQDNKIYNMGASAISLLKCETGLIAGNSCYNNGAWGISVLGRRNIIENNETYANGWMHGGCSGINIHGMGPDNIVRQNISYNNHQGTEGEVGYDWWSDGNGIIADQGADSTWIYNNICFGNDGPGVALTASSGCYVLNNTIIGNGFCEYAGYKSGLAVVTTLEDVREARNETIINNIFVDNAWYQLSIADVADDSHVLHHNLYYRGTNTKTEGLIYYRDLSIPDEQRVFKNVAAFREYWLSKGNDYFANGSLDVDPQLVCGLNMLTSAADAACTTKSPARFAGVNLTQWFDNDYYSITRPKDSMWDMGAVQYISHAPEAFSLLSPQDKEKVDDKLPLLRWYAAKDSDPGDSLYYTVKISPNYEFTNTVHSFVTADTEWTVTGELKDNTNYFWMVSACDWDGNITDSNIYSFITPDNNSITDSDNSKLPAHFCLYPNYPNPFNPSTTFQIDVPEKSFIRLNVFTATGQQVSVVYHGTVTVGTHRITWVPGDLPSGVYFARLRAGKFSQTIRLLYLK